ncbi:hypothetical protein NQZ68_014410, partial [Dissostichus eleginoides]
ESLTEVPFPNNIFQLLLGNSFVFSDQTRHLSRLIMKIQTDHFGYFFLDYSAEQPIHKV